ncbi:NAD(P)/FAD-dependent oxidoreductase [Natrarchaeobius chitinivorans]|uniref:FAD-binding oxidoreductase n=1 Tax=Natrarchaeobius chitinivorans TaxID=1679083 RepID=A0A3N6M389_NATCH|nr:FAD-dependent oxidoreductase [Natrarchaeobius chitinivorans]RQG89651.1 FAD-binding oxidoreductase [Natrarchaeobius chitinivorans]
MTSNTDEPTVIVVGGGIAGCQAARELAVDHTVTLLERDNVATGATGVSAGLVAPTLFYSDRPAVATYANEYVRRFDGTNGFEFHERDRLDFVRPTDRKEANATATELAEKGFPVGYLDASAVADRYPQFDLEGFAGAVLYEDTGWVDPYTYASAVRSTAEDAGATVEAGVTVTGVTTDDSGVTGVETADNGHYPADAVVVAAGWRTPQLLPDGASVPVRPYRTQCIVLEPESPLSDDFPLGRLGDEHLYFRPEHNGDLLIGGAHEPISDPLAASTDADESFTLEVADFVPSFIDGFEAAGFVNGWSGVDTASPDTRPIIGPPPGGPDGLIVATGFNGLGVMASPVVGPVVRHHLTGVSIEFSPDVFDPDRFDSVTDTFEYVSTSEI